MGDYDGGEIFGSLAAKLNSGEELTDIDMMNLTLLPLMRNTLPKYELAVKSVELAKTITDDRKREVCIAAVMAFAKNYLRPDIYDKLVEVTGMSSYLDDLESAFMKAFRARIDERAKVQAEAMVAELMTERKVAEKIEATVRNLFSKGYSVKEIAEITEFDEAEIMKLSNELVNA